MSFGIGEPAWSVQLRMARNPIPSFEPEWERQLRRARDPIQSYTPSAGYLEAHRHSPILPYAREPTLFERLKKADEEWDIHRLEKGSKLLASGTPPQFAWEENALSFTERMTGTKRRSTEQYIPASIFPPEDITGFKTRVNQYLKYQGIEPLTPKPEPWKSKYVNPFLTQEEPEEDPMSISAISKRMALINPKLYSILPKEEPETYTERLLKEAKMKIEIQEGAKRMLENSTQRMLEPYFFLNPQPKKPWEVDAFSGVSPPLTTRSGTTRYPGTDLWSKTLPDSSYIIGERGSGTHTHIGTDRHTGKEFVSIKDEKKGKSIFRTILEKLFSD